MGSADCVAQFFAMQPLRGLVYCEQSGNEKVSLYFTAGQHRIKLIFTLKLSRGTVFLVKILASNGTEFILRAFYCRVLNDFKLHEMFLFTRSGVDCSSEYNSVKN